MDKDFPDHTRPRVLLLVPNLQLDGGVTNYYRALNLGEEQGVTYFETSQQAGVSAPLRTLQLLVTYLRFFFAAPGSDLVHVNPTLDPRSMYRDMVFLALARLCRKPYLVFFRGWDNQLEERIAKSKIQTFLFMQTYGKAAGFCVLGKIFKEKLRKLGVPANCTFHILTTVADDAGLKQLDLSAKQASLKHQVNILFLARITESKGVFQSIEAVKALQKLIPQQVVLTVAGEGPELERSREIAQATNEVVIKFVGDVRGQEKYDLLNNHHIMLLPTSANEGLPNTLLEAMLYGMPIVSSAVAAIPEHVEDTINGFLIDSGDLPQITDALKTLCADQALFDRISNTNNAKAKQVYTTQTVRQQLLGVYEKTQLQHEKLSRA